MKKFIQIDEKTGAKSEVCSMGTPDHKLQFEVGFSQETARIKFDPVSKFILMNEPESLPPDSPPDNVDGGKLQPYFGGV